MHLYDSLFVFTILQKVFFHDIFIWYRVWPKKEVIEF